LVTGPADIAVARVGAGKVITLPPAGFPPDTFHAGERYGSPVLVSLSAARRVAHPVDTTPTHIKPINRDFMQIAFFRRNASISAVRKQSIRRRFGGGKNPETRGQLHIGGIARRSIGQSGGGAGSLGSRPIPAPNSGGQQHQQGSS
jgi:hypothetical protein